MKTIIEDLPRVTVRDVARAGVFSRGVGCGTLTANLNGSPEPVLFRVERGDQGPRAIVFRTFVPGGARVETRVGLIARPTNLGVGAMWLFRSPATGTPCRVLYLVHGQLVGRCDLECPRYRQQLQGRKQRENSDKTVNEYAKESKCK